jgi:ribonuclease PH
MAPFSIKQRISGPGSAYIEWGDPTHAVKMIAVVRGPRQQMTNRPPFEVDVSFAGFFSQDREGIEIGTDISTFIRDGIESAIDWNFYPQSTIGVFIKVIEGPQSELDQYLAPGILVVVEALKDASIKLSDDVSCSTLALDATGAISSTKGDDTVAQVSVGILRKTGAVSAFHQSGILPGGSGKVPELIAYAKMGIESMRNQLARYQ